MTLLVIVPQITFAAWWNPFTWFNNWGKVEIQREATTNTNNIVDRTQETKNQTNNVNTETDASSTKKLAELNAQYISLNKEITKLQGQQAQAAYGKITLTKEEDAALEAKITPLLNKMIATYAEINKLHAAIKNAAIISNSASIDSNIDNVYTKYCGNAAIINLKAKISDYNNSYFKISALDLGILKTNLENAKYNDSEIPLALYSLGLKLTQAGKIDNGVKIYQCAAEKYYDRQAMYKLADLYKTGTDVIKKQYPNVEINTPVFIDYSKAYYWISAVIYVETAEPTGFANTSTRTGWNIVAMLDDLQNTSKLTSAQRKTVEDSVKKFINVKYPGI